MPTGSCFCPVVATGNTGQRNLILAGRQYGQQPLDLLPLETVEILGEGQRIVRFEKKLYLLLSRRLAAMDWQLHHVSPLAPVQERAAGSGDWSVCQGKAAEAIVTAQSSGS